MPLEHEVELTIPVDAAPSAEGKITKVRWKVVATLARPHARDVHGEARVEVLSPAASDALAAPDVDAHGDCRLSFELRRSDFGPGDAVEGTLVANPLRECRLDEVRVELRRDEKVPRKKGNEARVREAEVKLDAEVELSTLVPREWPFRLELPADLVPCLETEESRVTWSLKGVASRRLRFDERVTLPIDVHTAPSRES